MRLGGLMVEAKLTETGFQNAPLRLVDRYEDFNDVFDISELPRSSDLVRHYQIIRGVLAAYSTGGSFCLICDGRRPDLVESWYSIVRVVRGCDLRCRLQLVTWQELAGAVPKALQQFLGEKYGIYA